MKKVIQLTALFMMLVMLASCSAAPAESIQSSEPAGSFEQFASVEEIAQTFVPLAEAPPATMVGVSPVASGIAAKTVTKATIDYSNVTDGYVMVQYTASTSKKLKAQVKGPDGVTYTYNVTAGKWEVFSLSGGNGNYQVTVFENTSGNKYSTVVSASFSATLKDEFAPFLLSNQYVNFSNAPLTLEKAKELTSGSDKLLDKVKAVYEFTVTTLTYDKDKAATVKSGYLPVVDTVLTEKKGICFDYAALMAAMLRSQGIPCKLVVGYAGTAYHAWINVYSEESGWISNAIYFDGISWKLMDPTFASSGNQSDSIMNYIGDGKNYSAKYIY